MKSQSNQGRGKPTRDGAKSCRRINVTLDNETAAKARKIGNGNLSEGLRRAITILASSGLV